MILDLGDIQEKKEENVSSHLSETSSFVLKEIASSNSKHGVIKRILHTRTEISIYPNGQSYILKSASWFEDKIYYVKKKEKKKSAPVKKVVKKEVEVY